MRKFNNKCSILERDLSSVDKIMSDFKKEREMKSKVFNGYAEYIDFLEQRLDMEDDIYKKYLIEKEIKKLKKEQKKYYVPSILEIARFDLVKRGEKRENSLEKSDFSLIKKVKTRSRKSS